MSECCLCCPDNEFSDKCFCGCCPCPPTGNLCFSFTHCGVHASPSPGMPIGDMMDCSCMDCWQDIPLTRDLGYKVCERNAENVGGFSPACGYEYGDESASGIYNEAWGFSGKLPHPDPTDCGPWGDPYIGTDCGGMCCTIGLCCQRTGIHTLMQPDDDPPPGHPCPQYQEAQCKLGEVPAGQPTSELLGDHACLIDCFCFRILPYNCYECDTDGNPATPPVPTPCSSCSSSETEDGSTISCGSWSTTYGAGYEPYIISGQCANPNVDRKFMLQLTGKMMIDCDCQTGIITPPPGGGPTPSLPLPTPAILTWTGVIVECD